MSLVQRELVEEARKQFGKKPLRGFYCNEIIKFYCRGNVYRLRETMTAERTIFFGLILRVLFPSSTTP